MACCQYGRTKRCRTHVVDKREIFVYYPCFCPIGMTGVLPGGPAGALVEGNGGVGRGHHGAVNHLEKEEEEEEDIDLGLPQPLV